MRCTFISGLGLPVAFVLVSLAVQSAASAQVTTPVAKHEGRGGIVETLCAAHKLLSEADRDYQGHRAKAAEEIGKALKELGHHVAAKTTAAATTASAPVVKKASAPPGKAVHEAQNSSDTQMKQALQLLEGAMSAHVNVKHARTEHVRAGRNIKNAIGEINTALSIK